MKLNKMILPVLMIVFVSFLFVMLILQNMVSTRIQFLLFGATVPVIVIILSSGLLGFLMGILVTMVVSLRSKEKKKINDPTAKGK